MRSINTKQQIFRICDKYALNLDKNQYLFKFYLFIKS